MPVHFAGQPRQELGGGRRLERLLKRTSAGPQLSALRFRDRRTAGRAILCARVRERPRSGGCRRLPSRRSPRCSANPPGQRALGGRIGVLRKLGPGEGLLLGSVKHRVQQLLVERVDREGDRRTAPPHGASVSPGAADAGPPGLPRPVVVDSHVVAGPATSTPATARTASTVPSLRRSTGSRRMRRPSSVARSATMSASWRSEVMTRCPRDSSRSFRGGTDAGRGAGYHIGANPH